MRYVVIGNSAAAIGAVEGIRSRDKDGEIVLISEENHHTYSRPLISYLLAGKISEQEIYYRPMDFYEENQVEVFLGEKATHVLPKEQKVFINPPGLDFDYDKLLIATGGTPVTPGCFLGYHENLFYFHKWDDINRIKMAADPDKVLKVAVIGGGLIGLKAAESLKLREQEVTVIEAGPCLLNSILDFNAAGIVEKYLRSRGINIILSNSVSQVIGDQKIEKLVLANGIPVECDMVIMAAGVKPNLGCISDTQMEIDRGIKVNEYLETSLENIYAAGDVAQMYDAASDSYKLVPILPNAYRQGKIAGLNMTGQQVKCEGLMAFNSLPLLGLNTATAGLSSALDDNRLEIVEKNKDEFNYKKLVFSDNKLAGFTMIGDIGRCGIYRFLIEKGINISSFKDQLMKDDFGLMDLPPVINY